MPRMDSKLMLASLLSLGLSACAGAKIPEDHEKGLKKADEVTIGEQEAATLSIERGSLAGATVQVPSGATAAGTKIALSPSVLTPSSFSENTELVAAGAVVDITALDEASQTVSELSRALLIDLPLAPKTTLAVPQNPEELCVLLVSNSSLFVWRRPALAVTDTKLSFESRRLGSYQAFYCGMQYLKNFSDAATSGHAGAASKVLAVFNLGWERTTSAAKQLSHACATLSRLRNDKIEYLGISDLAVTAGLSIDVKVLPMLAANLGALADTDSVYLGLSYMTAEHNCTLAGLTGASAPANVSFAFQKPWGAVKAGTLSAKLGEHSGAFGLGSLKFQLGRSDGAATASAAKGKACLRSEWSGDGGGYVESYTSFDTDNTVAGISDITLNYINGPAEAGTKIVRAFANSERCSDAKMTAIFPSLDAQLYLSPYDLTFNLSDAVVSASSQVCLRFYSAGSGAASLSESDKRKKALGSLLIKASEKSAKVYLPFQTGAVYDLGVKQLQLSEDCNSDLSEKISTGFTLAPQTSIGDAQVAK